MCYVVWLFESRHASYYLFLIPHVFFFNDTFQYLRGFFVKILLDCQTVKTAVALPVLVRLKGVNGLVFCSLRREITCLEPLQPTQYTGTELNTESQCGEKFSLGIEETAPNIQQT